MPPPSRPVQPTSFEGSFEAVRNVESITISHDVAVAGTIPVLRFPNAARITSAFLVAKYSSSGTNVLRVGLINGGVVLGGIGTKVVAATNDGTVLAGSAYQLNCRTDGPERFAPGEWLCLNIAAGMTPNAGFDVTIDYIID